MKGELKNSCETNNVTSSALPLPKKDTTTVTAEKYFLPFELACQSKASRIVVTALDCLQKLIAYGHLTGNVPDSTSQKKFLIDRIVETICSCFVGPTTDEGVQLQIIKALLTVVTSQHVEVHEVTLLTAVKTCYNIYLASKNLVNQTTARATLTQMLNVIFTRMENQALEEQYRNSKNEGVKEKTNLPINGSISGDSGNEINIKSEKALESNNVSNPYDLEEKRVENISISFEDNSISDDAFEEPASENDLDIVKEVLQKVVEDVVVICEQGSLDNTAPSVEAADSNNIENDQVPPLKFTHALQNDAFLVFRSLCRLSMKPLPEGIPDPKLVFVIYFYCYLLLMKLFWSDFWIFIEFFISDLMS